MTSFGGVFYKFLGPPIISAHVRAGTSRRNQPAAAGGLAAAPCALLPAPRLLRMQVRLAPHDAPSSRLFRLQPASMLQKKQPAEWGVMSHTSALEHLRRPPPLPSPLLPAASSRL